MVEMIFGKLSSDCGDLKCKNKQNQELLIKEKKKSSGNGGRVLNRVNSNNNEKSKSAQG